MMILFGWVYEPFRLRKILEKMFILSTLEHTVKLHPSLLHLELVDAIKAELEDLLLDKIIADLGLCVSVYDIQSIDDGFINPGDGYPTYMVKFRLIIFRPFVGEVISGKLLESTPEVLKLSLGFFEDIYIPPALLPHPCESKPDPVNRNLVQWVWKFDDNSYPIDGVDEIKFRVHEVSFPPVPLEQDEDAKPFAPMVVTGSLDADGLGPVSWWDGDDAANEEVDDAADEEVDDEPGDALAAMPIDPPHLHNHFSSKDDRRQQAKLYMDEHGKADKSLAVTWLAVHGVNTICIVTKEEDLMCLVRDLEQSSTVDHFLPRFWNAIVSKVEDLSDNMVRKIPFHAVDIYSKGDQKMCSMEDANMSLRRELKGEESQKEFTYDQTLKTTVLCSQKLFCKELKAHEIRVFAWKLIENTGAELDRKHVEDLLAEIEADRQKRMKRD